MIQIYVGAIIVFGIIANLIILTFDFKTEIPNQDLSDSNDFIKQEECSKEDDEKSTKSIVSNLLNDNESSSEDFQRITVNNI